MTIIVNPILCNVVLFSVIGSVSSILLLFLIVINDSLPKIRICFSTFLYISLIISYSFKMSILFNYRVLSPLIYYFGNSSFFLYNDFELFKFLFALNSLLISLSISIVFIFLVLISTSMSMLCSSFW